MVHNLGDLDLQDEQAAVPQWAGAFEAWTHERLVAGQWDALQDYRRQAPEAERAHPSEDHFLPLFFAGGAGGTATALHRSFAHGSLSMASYGFA
jgi:4,5-DOPA dioxygenase extradiol